MRARSASGLPAAAAAVLFLLPPAAVAQEGAVSGTDRPGWLGVGIVSYERCPGERPSGSDAGCREVLVVGGLVHGGPGERAGVQPGDTLLAIDGNYLDEGLRDDAFDALKPGRSARLLVGRPSGRDTIVVVPGVRPDSVAVLQLRPSAPGSPGAPAYALAVPAPAPVLDSLARAVLTAPGAEAAVRPHVRVVEMERVKRIPLRVAPGAPTPPHPSAAAQQRREMSRRAARMEDRAERAARHHEEVEAAWRRWADEELQARLRGIYDSVLAVARTRLDSLRELREDRLDSLREMREELAAEAWGRRRVAGAAFQPLSAGLAEFVPGSDRGLLVLEVLPGSPADRLGLRPGDVVVEAGGRAVDSVAGLRRALATGAAGPMIVKWIRKGALMEGDLGR